MCNGKWKMLIKEEIIFRMHFHLQIFIAALIMQRACGALKSMLRLLRNVNYSIISTPWENLYSKRISAN